MSNARSLAKTILVGIDLPINGDIPTMVVGEKMPEENFNVLNIIHGEEAIELWKKLTGSDKND